MIGTGTLLNAAAIILGTAVGRALGARLPDRLQETQMAAVGLLTVVLGVQSALTVFAPGQPPRAFLAVLLALLLGGWIGELVRLPEGIEALGRRAERALAPKASANGESDTDPTDTGGAFVRAFVTASLLFCVGPLAILGSFDDALRGDIAKLTVKSVLDGVAAMAFGAALGWGVLLSAGSVLIVQGALTLGASLLRPLLSDAAISVLTGAGGVMLLGLGLNLLGLTKIRTAALLPALVFGPALLWLLTRVGA